MTILKLNIDHIKNTGKVSINIVEYLYAAINTKIHCSNIPSNTETINLLIIIANLNDSNQHYEICTQILNFVEFVAKQKNIIIKTTNPI